MSLPCIEQWSSVPERAPERHLNEQEDVFEIHKQEVACQKVLDIKQYNEALKYNV